MNYSKVTHMGMVIKPSHWHNDVLMWRVPNLGGQVFASVGMAMEAIRRFRDDTKA
jgi:hypothetical protein